MLLLLIGIAVIVAVVLLVSSGRSKGEHSARAMKLPSDSQASFIVCTFSMLAKLAAADGEISSSELARVERYIDEELQLNKKTKALALKVFQDAASSPLELRDYAEQFRKSFPERVQVLDKMIEILVALSLADGVLEPREDKQIRSAALLLGLSEAGYERIKKKLTPVSTTVH